MGLVILSDLRKLEYGWGGGSEEPPTVEALRVAEEIASTTPTVHARRDGGLTIEWRNRARQLLLEISITPEGALEAE